jgi:hypothetical protein
MCYIHGMPSNLDAPLLRQLAANSDPYRDPLALIDWRKLSLEDYWLPQEALSLYGLEEFEALSEPAKVRLSQVEMLGHAQAGIALERIFLELTASRLRHATQGAEYAFLLHEMREEAGHSLMFLKLAALSGIRLPDWRSALPRIARPASRALPHGAMYWAMLMIGEDIPDKLNRYVRRHVGGSFSPVIRQMITLHMVDEARHIAFAREQLQATMAGRGRFSAGVFSVLLDRLFNRFVRGYFWPHAELYHCAGLGDGKAWRRLALRSPWRREFVLRLVAPTMRLLESQGISVRLR